MEPHRGKPSVSVAGLGAGRPGGTAVLTYLGDGVSVDALGGHEAEDTIRDIVYLSQKLLTLVVAVKEMGDGGS